MNIYNGIEYIKDYLNGTAKKTIGANASEDVKILGCLVNNCRKIRSRNGVNYYYLFLSNNSDLQIVYDLLSRNGFLPRVHNTKYSIVPTQIIRIPTDSVKKDADKVEFLHQIQLNAYNVALYKEIQDKIVALRDEKLKQNGK